MNVLVVDGYNLYAACNATSGKLCRSDGFPTGALYGVIRSIESQVNKRSIDRVWFALEGGGQSVRQKFAPDVYKANRDPDAPSVARWHEQHHDLLFEWAKARGVRVIWGEGLEADDAIAFVHMRERGHRQFILSRDHDFRSLLDSRTELVWGDKRFGEDDFVSMFGFKPSLYEIYLAVAGDPSDNVPRVLMPAKAKKLMQSMPPNGRALAHVQANLSVEQYHEALRNLALVKKRTDESFFVCEPTVDRDALRSLYDTLEFRSLAKVLDSAGALR